MYYRKTSVIFKVNSGTGPNSDPTSTLKISSNLWIDYPLLESLDCLSSSNWTFWTLWDETLLEKIYPWLEMSPGVFYRASLSKLERVVKDGFRRVSRDELNYADNVVVVKVLKQKEEPFRPISETTCLEVLEYSFLEERVTINSTPMKLIACSGLADILREVHRETDILMIRGSFQRAAVSDDSGDEKIYLLINASDDCGDVQLIRLTFLDDATTELIEEIKPRPLSNRFVFKYTAVALTPSNTAIRRRTAVWHQNFRWQKSQDYGSFKRRWTGCEETLAEFEGPISAQQDAVFAYRKLMEVVPNCDSNLESANVYTRSIPREKIRTEKKREERRGSSNKRRRATKAPGPDTYKRLFVYVLMLSCFVIGGLTWMTSDLSTFTKCSAKAKAQDLFVKKAEKPTGQIMETVVAYISSIILWIKLFCANCVRDR